MDAQSYLYGDTHDLIRGRQERAADYSALTIKRANVVWYHLGFKNNFYDVCDYYHRLEALENQMPVEQRTASRQRELDLEGARPPASQCLLTLFPDLYSRREPPSDDSHCAALVGQHCASTGTSLREFVLTFRKYAIKNNVNPTVSNAAFYIKHQMVLRKQMQEKLAGIIEETIVEERQIKADVKEEIEDGVSMNEKEVTECNDTEDGVSTNGKEVTDCKNNDNKDNISFEKFVKQWEKVKEANRTNSTNVNKLEKYYKNYISNPYHDESSNQVLEENMKKLTICIRKYGHM